MKIALLVRTRNRNKYLDFFIDYYQKLGIDTIFIVDNNTNENLAKDNIKNHQNVVFFVKNDHMIAFWNSPKIVHDCMFEIKEMGYDYILYIDDDEFLNIGQYSDIHDFVEDYKNYDILYFVWKTYTDNGYIFDDELPFAADNVIANYTEEFSEEMTHDKVNCYGHELFWTKYLVKCELLNEYDNWEFYGDHYLTDINDGRAKLFIDEYNEFHVKHYRTKHFEEFLRNKILNVNLFYSENFTYQKNDVIANYVLFNNIDDEKLERIKRCLKKYNVKCEDTKDLPRYI